MPTEEPRFSVDKTLSNALKIDPEWQIAQDTAQRLFNDIVFFLAPPTTPLQRLQEIDMLLDMMPLIAKFIASGFRLADPLVGQVSFREIFDEPSVLLEVQPQRPEMDKHGMEFIFNKRGHILHAAVI